MRILWLEEKAESEWGVFDRDTMIDTKMTGIPDEDAYNMVTSGVVELIDASDEPTPQKWWDKKKKKLVPISEKPEPLVKLNSSPVFNNIPKE